MKPRTIRRPGRPFKWGIAAAGLGAAITLGGCAQRAAEARLIEPTHRPPVTASDEAIAAVPGIGHRIFMEPVTRTRPIITESGLAVVEVTSQP